MPKKSAKKPSKQSKLSPKSKKGNKKTEKKPQKQIKIVKKVAKTKNKTNKLAKKTVKTLKKTPANKSTTKKITAIKKLTKPKTKKPRENKTKTTKIIKITEKLKAKIFQKKTPDKKPSIKAVVAIKPVEAKNNTAKNTSAKTKKYQFKVGECAVYPSHGVGKISEIEKMSVLGRDFECYLMYFEREKLTIKIPVSSSEKTGLRKLVSRSAMEEVLQILRSGVKKLKGMWSRRAQEYESKINSGDIVMLAEVLRDLTRDIDDSERSYSERIIYETGITRLASEYSAIYDLEFEEAKNIIITTARDKIDGAVVIKNDHFDDVREDSDEEVDEEEVEDEEYDEDDEERASKKAKKSR
jgi:CarD family transcriptional regulator